MPGVNLDEALVSELSALVSRPPAVVLVGAGPGMGKSWLVRRVVAASQRAGMTVSAGCRGLPDGQYVVVRELVDALVEAGCDRERAGGALRALESAERSWSGENEYRVCRAVRGLLVGAVRRIRSAAARQGCEPAVLVVLEDVECADAPSRRVMRYVVERPTDGVALILTYTPDGGPSPLGARLGSAVSGGVHEFRPAPLPQSQVAAWAAEVAGAPPPQRWAESVHQLTGGVPLFVGEVLARLTPEDGDVRQALSRKGMPEVIAAAAVERLARLPVRARRLTAVAALIRGPVAVSLLAQVCALPVGAAEAGLSRAVDAGVMSPAGGGLFTFAPPVLGLAVGAGLPAVDRRRWHGAIARALESQESDAALHELVFHTRAAGDVTASARFAERAAERAVRAGDTAEAIELLQGLLADPALPRRSRAALAGRLGRLALTSLAYVETVALLRAILTDERLPEGVRGELRLHLGLLLSNQAGDGDTGRVELIRAARELRRRPAPAARAMSALALPYWGSCALREHLWWLEQAERTVPGRGDPALLTAVVVNRASVLMEIGDPRAWEAAAALPRDGATPSERQQLVRGYVNLADAAICLGHHAAATDFLARADDLAGCAGPTYARHLAAATGLRLAWATGRWAGLAADAHQHLGEGARSPFGAADAFLVLAQLALTQGEWDEAEEFLRAPGLQPGSGWTGPEFTVGAATRIRLALVRGQLPVALAEATRATALIRGKGVWAWAGELVDAAVEAMLRGGELRRAGQLLDEFARDIATRDCPFGQAMLAHCRGATATAAGRHDEAAGLHAEAATRLAALSRPYEQARALEAAARCRLAAPVDPARTTAARQLADAAQLFTTLGATWEAARCTRLLRDHGGTPSGRPGRRGYGDRLSPREREVCRLIALGRTNRQIADLLFLSPRTVERHVAGVMRKLGCTARDQVRLPAVD